jgi:hypothetical protein
MYGSTGKSFLCKVNVKYLCCDIDRMVLASSGQSSYCAETFGRISSDCDSFQVPALMHIDFVQFRVLQAG